MLKINKLNIKDISCIKDIDINFNSRINFICGSNGIGKSAILESISGFFYGPYGNSNIKKRFNTEHGVCSGAFEMDGSDENFSYRVDSFHPKESKPPNIHELHKVNNEVIFIKTNRQIEYKELTEISLKHVSSTYDNNTSRTNGMSGDDIKNWLIHRVLFAKQEKGLSSGKLKNLNFAIDAFSIVDKRFSYSHLDSDRHDIVISTPSGDICFEYLSSGFKSTIYLIIGLIKEIESRYPDGDAREFSGIIMIDEPEIHLHPAWQAKIAKILKESFINAQFICATHSPHIIQEASADEVITLEFDEKSEVRVKSMIHREYGFKGWTVEEILTDVMGMDNPRSSFYLSLKEKFYNAIDNGDESAAKNSYHKLISSLHEDNPEKRIIKIDMACFVGGLV